MNEKCSLCGNKATHKVAEDNPILFRHPFTNYLCCPCFGKVMGLIAIEWCNNKHVEFPDIQVTVTSFPYTTSIRFREL